MTRLNRLAPRLRDALAVGALLSLLMAAGVAPASAQMLMNGAGATFPYPIYSKWFDEYTKVDPSVRFNYQSIGSGGGIRQITARTVDFGATDGPMTDEQLKAARGELVHIPTVLGAVVATYNTFELGRLVTLHVTLPGGFEFKSPGRVHFVRDPMDMSDEAEPGMGVKFEALATEHRELVLRFVRKRPPMFYDD